MDIRLPSLEQWLAGPRADVRGDPVWRLPAYQNALFAADVAWPDVLLLSKHPVTAPIAGQLYRALGSVGANLSEGYSRSSGRDRVRLYEYSLGSARESVVWYRLGLPLLGHEIVQHRQDTLERIIRMLLITIPRERHRNLGRDS
ncbi:CHP02436-containing protein [Gemmatirosa kalamazoonensis]|uniref:CHP02436-containing protein n=1 Tax=Gemmatirosa kalamazoonensis TaxID=861299 RepID=W0RBM4_9BACT|nr:four helix bundle protein [Gemmatirosa kalamazoonensis]AHG87857.1 CHP02436-containing protein [Gemmatirosa kalamazoonensis]